MLGGSLEPPHLFCACTEQNHTHASPPLVNPDAICRIDNDQWVHSTRLIFEQND